MIRMQPDNQQPLPKVTLEYETVEKRTDDKITLYTETVLVVREGGNIHRWRVSDIESGAVTISPKIKSALEAFYNANT